MNSLQTYKKVFNKTKKNPLFSLKSSLRPNFPHAGHTCSPKRMPNTGVKQGVETEKNLLAELLEEKVGCSVYHRNDIRTFTLLYTDKWTFIFEENLTIYGQTDEKMLSFSRNQRNKGYPNKEKRLLDNMNTLSVAFDGKEATTHRQRYNIASYSANKSAQKVGHERKPS